MQLIKISIYLFALVAFSNTCFAGEFSAWEDATPYGNKLYHDGGIGRIVELTIDDSSVWFNEFYFYKGHTIAKGKEIFYIINEKTNKIEEFHNEQAFKKALTEKKLNPIFITRWYDDDYGIDKFWVPISMILLPFPFIMPIIWLICLISLFTELNKMLLLRKIIVWGYPIIALLVLIIYNLPQSF
ncbi:hypothetical protein [Flavobacterium aestivum]|uniref:hypothetical protein n=1 Tax=Flavobacterium aestivum TaxID=3003257 RepID=UPI00228590CF|nr:hypothetical protein [Flavobacterium aestivum]